MAGALAGGSFIYAFLQVLFDRMASRQVLDFCKGQKLSERFLEKLSLTVNFVDGVLDDAEEKQIIRPAVKRWLEDLKGVAYEADDLFVEVPYEAMGLEMEAACSKTSTDQVRKSSLLLIHLKRICMWN
ncbi:putative disease resistance RPP13-like protein 1 [Ricinus communis]|uniref:Disease resistance N-terminal domain-containing protein n=1 Tax=Ricinus communis TaxID=3988 RepID=B9S4K3_RICCO|nr:putative disease resistance RPP13-like protein 1 [Ricinus communis]EEF41467.1 hypothetical protein RCOM_0809570 [Ricinus communis]